MASLLLLQSVAAAGGVACPLEGMPTAAHANVNAAAHGGSLHSAAARAPVSSVPAERHQHECAGSACVCPVTCGPVATQPLTVAASWMGDRFTMARPAEHGRLASITRGPEPPPPRA